MGLFALDSKKQNLFIVRWYDSLFYIDVTAIWAYNMQYRKNDVIEFNGTGDGCD
jgi:hypothetical protein